jgi:Gpi18-like mannosyltransferase
MMSLWRAYRRECLLATVFLAISSLLFHIVTALTFSDWGFAASLDKACRWDCGWYAAITTDGYHSEPSGHDRGDAANWAFFPLFPLLGKLLAETFGIPAKVALPLTSKLFLWLSILVFMIVARRWHGHQAVPLAGALVAFNPYVVYAHAGYTETLYFCLTALAFLALWSRRWLAVGLATGLLSATRLVGLMMSLALLVAMLRDRILSRGRADQATALLALAIAPLGLAVFMAYLYWLTGDALAFMHIQIAWDRSMQFPFIVLISGLQETGWGLYFSICALAGLVMAVWLYRKGHREAALFLAGTLLIPLATGLASMPRYLFWQFPFVFGMLELCMRYPMLKRAYLPVAGIGAMLMFHFWHSGHSFVT